MDQFATGEQKGRLKGPLSATSQTQNTNLAHLNKLKNEIDALIVKLDACTDNPNMTESDWQHVINLRYSAKLKLDFANSRLNELLKQSGNESTVVNLQLKRFQAIFDQIVSEFNMKCKRLDQRYSRFTLFESAPAKTKVLDSGQVVVEAIMDVESLTNQANMNLEVIKKGNAKMNKIYSKLNIMVKDNLYDINKLQKNIHCILLKNRNIASVVMGICIFIITYKLVLCRII